MAKLGIYFASALALSLLLTPFCRFVAHHLGFVAKPREDRWHKRPTALFGGIAIALSTLIVGLTVPADVPLWQLMGCAVAIAAFGLADDLLTLKASTKLIIQITVASVLLFLGYRLQWTDSQAADAMLTLFWIVGVSNAFNLLDNMDGLCAGTALVAGGFLLIGTVNDSGVTAHALYLAALLGATAGFLVYNLHPATIFMGDTGSLFLGLNLAALTLLANPESSGRSGFLSVVVAPVLPLMIPIFDTTLVTALRLLSGRRATQGGRDHTSHRLVAVGLSEPRAVATLWLLAAAGGTIAVVLRRDPGWATTAALAFLLAMIIFGVYLARIRVYDDADLARLKEGTVTPLVTTFMYKRRVAEVLLDLCLIPLAYYSAYRLRFEGALLAANYQLFLQSLPVLLSTQLLALFIVGGYRGTWRYFGMMDAVVFAKAVLIGTVAAQTVILYAYRFESYSRTVFVIYAVLFLLLLIGTRASFRLVGEFVHRRRVAGQRCVVYGTGGASITTIRDAFGGVALKIIGFVDDDPRHRNSRISGYQVIGDYSNLLALIEHGEVDCVVMNTHLVDVRRQRELESICRELDVDLLKLHIYLKPVSTAS